MKSVKLMGWSKEGQPELQGTIELVGGQLTADTATAKHILGEEYAWNDRWYSQKDGEEFLKILPNVVSGGYLQAVPNASPERHSRDPYEGTLLVMEMARAEERKKRAEQRRAERQPPAGTQK